MILGSLGIKNIFLKNRVQNMYGKAIETQPNFNAESYVFSLGIFLVAILICKDREAGDFFE